MNKLDRMIEDALDAEDRAILAEFPERGMFGDIAGLFTGKYGLINLVTVAVQLIAFAGALYAGREFLSAADIASMLRWGALFAVLFSAMSVIKLMQWQQVQANRVIREVKRVELQIARSRAV